MDDAATNDFADQILAALAAEERLQPLSEHRWEVLSAATQLIVGAMNGIEDAGYRQWVCDQLANHIATLPSKLKATRRPKLRLVTA